MTEFDDLVVAAISDCGRDRPITMTRCVGVNQDELVIISDPNDGSMWIGVSSLCEGFWIRKRDVYTIRIAAQRLIEEIEGLRGESDEEGGAA